MLRDGERQNGETCEATVERLLFEHNPLIFGGVLDEDCGTFLEALPDYSVLALLLDAHSHWNVFDIVLSRPGPRHSGYALRIVIHKTNPCELEASCMDCDIAGLLEKFFPVLGSYDE
ncbi:hypothetical protein D3C71_1059120 [compost metagenome]